MLQKAVDDPFFELCEAIESLNGRGNSAQNSYSADLSESLSLPSTAGSDAHRVSQLGTAATEFHGRVECVADLIMLLKNGQFRPVDLLARVAGT